MTLRAAIRGDIPEIAALHKSRFADDLLGSLSVQLLGRLYDIAFGRLPIFVHASESGVDGFVIGGDVAEISRCRREFWQANWRACVWYAAWRPLLWAAHARRAIDFLAARRQTTAVALPQGFARLWVIAVAKSSSGKGVGTLLMREFESGIRGQHGAYYLTTGTDNTVGSRLYEKMGMSLAAVVQRTKFYVKSFDTTIIPALGSKQDPAT